MSLRILLTGSSGFVGRALLRHASLQNSEDHWIGLDRVPIPEDAQRPRHFSFVECDLADLPSCANAIGEAAPQVVIHLAGIAAQGQTPEQDTALFNSHVNTTWNLLNVLEKPCHVILASSGLVYGPQQAPFHEEMPCQPDDSYALCKALAEQMLQSIAARKGFSWTVIRPSVLYGPGQQGNMFIPALCRALRNGQDFPMSGGEQLRDFLHIDDFSRAILSLQRQQCPGTYNIAAGTSCTLLQVAEMAGRISQRAALIKIGALPYRKNEVWNYSLSTKKIQQACLWKATISLEQGLTALLTPTGAST